jgi:hypothetical protein
MRSSYVSAMRLNVGFSDIYCELCGPGSSVGIANGYGLDCPGIESQWERPVQTGPEDHSASYTMGTGSFPGVESGRGMMLTP